MKVTRQQIKAKLTWKQKVCIITKDFFIAIKPKPYKVGISTLKDDVKVITTSHVKAQEDHFGNKKLQHKVFDFLPKFFFEWMNKKFIAPSSLEEF